MDRFLKTYSRFEPNEVRKIFNAEQIKEIRNCLYGRYQNYLIDKNISPDERVSYTGDYVWWLFVDFINHLNFEVLKDVWDEKA